MSVIGVGVDIVFLPDFKKAMTKKGFLNRVFSKQEIRFCKNKAFPLQHFAARFAAKEAVFKALGRPVSYAKVEVRTSAAGKPSLSFLSSKPKDTHCKVSLAHVKEYALAFVVCSKP